MRDEYKIMWLLGQQVTSGKKYADFLKLAHLQIVFNRMQLTAWYWLRH